MMNQKMNTATINNTIDSVKESVEAWAKMSIAGGVEDSLEVMDLLKARFDGFVRVITELTGLEQVASYIGYAINDNIDNDGHVNSMGLAEELYGIIMDEAAELESRKDSESLKKAMALKQLCSDGQEHYRSVFSILISGMLYVGKVVARKAKKFMPGYSHPIARLAVHSIIAIGKGLIGLGKAFVKGVTYGLCLVIGGVTKVFMTIGALVMAGINAIKYRKTQPGPILYYDKSDPQTIDEFFDNYSDEELYQDAFEDAYDPFPKVNWDLEQNLFDEQ